MSAVVTELSLTKHQERVLTLLFKFRFITSHSLASIIGVRREAMYKVLEHLVRLGVVTKVYEASYRIDRKQAYYYLNKSGVTLVRKILDVPETAVHALYKNDKASKEFIAHCQTVSIIYGAVARNLPNDSQLYTKAELQRFTQFPKNLPDLYVTSAKSEAFVYALNDKAPYISRKYLNEVLAHFEEEGWDGDYPTIGFILKDGSNKYAFLYAAYKRLESLGIDNDEITIKAASIEHFIKPVALPWSSFEKPNDYGSLIK